MSEAYHWRLLYANGDCADEPEDTTSILVCPAGAMAIVVTRAGGPPEKREAVCMEYMEHERLPKHGPWVPLFYRKRSGGLDSAGNRTDLVVFGRGCEGPNEVSSRLWAVVGGKPVDCPAWALDAGAVQGNVMESLSGVTR